MSAELNDKQDEVLSRIARDSKNEDAEWVNIDGVDLRIVRALERARMVAFNQVGGKRLARVTAAGWKYLGVEPKPLQRAVDIKPMESFDPAKVWTVVESKARGDRTPPPALTPGEKPAETVGILDTRGVQKTADQERGATKSWGTFTSGKPDDRFNRAGPTLETGDWYAKDCEGCVFREVVERLAKRNPLVRELVVEMERLHALEAEILGQSDED